MIKFLVHILFFLIFINFSFSQCIKCELIEINKSYYMDATYIGCLNVNDAPHGKGVLLDSKNDTIYKGCFKNGKFSGEGVSYYFSEDQNVTRVGEFKEGKFFNGIETTIASDNIIYTSQYDSFNRINEKNNITNYYSADDIYFIDNEASDYVKVKIERRDNHFWIPMRVSNTHAEWIFDTGGAGLSIGKKLWDRMLSEGVDYKDLKIDTQTSGVGGSSRVKYVLLDKIFLGDVFVKNIVAVVRYDGNYSLMGAQFYDKFSNVKWDMKKNEVLFYK